MRSIESAACWRPSNTFISDLAVGHGHKSLLATSGDGRLFKIDRREKELQQSDANESELLSVDIVKVH